MSLSSCWPTTLCDDPMTTLPCPVRAKVAKAPGSRQQLVK